MLCGQQASAARTDCRSAHCKEQKKIERVGADHITVSERA